MVVYINGGKKRYDNQVVSEQHHITNGGTLELYNCTFTGSITGDGTANLVVSGGSFEFGSPEKQPASAKLGGEELQPGDWLEIVDGGLYSHHTIYVGEGKFIGFQKKGVIIEDETETAGWKQAKLKYRGGSSAAQNAKSREKAKETGYNLLYNNCEQFASHCCGKPQTGSGGQVQVGIAKTVATGALCLLAFGMSGPGVLLPLIFGGFAVNRGGASVGYSIKC